MGVKTTQCTFKEVIRDIQVTTQGVARYGCIFLWVWRTWLSRQDDKQYKETVRDIWDATSLTTHYNAHSQRRKRAKKHNRKGADDIDHWDNHSSFVENVFYLFGWSWKRGVTCTFTATFGQPMKPPISPQVDCWVITNHRNNNQTKTKIECHSHCQVFPQQHSLQTEPLRCSNNQLLPSKKPTHELRLRSLAHLAKM